MFRLILAGVVSIGSTCAHAADLDRVRSAVSQFVKEIPSGFPNVGIVSSKHGQQPLPGAVLAYARFYWALDRIEGNCEFLGQRSNIEMVDPPISTLVTYAEINEKHPDHKEYLRIAELIDGAEETLGEDTLCPAMYEMFGPDGSLMAGVLNINGLLEDGLRRQYEVRVEDGVLWSMRDYCERKYYLQPPAAPEFHKYACEKAKRQKF